MLDIKTLIDAELVKAQAAVDTVGKLAASLVEKATSVITIAANTADGGVGGTVGVTVPAQAAYDALKAELEALKGQYNDLLATHPTPPPEAAPLPLETPPAEKPAE